MECYTDSKAFSFFLVSKARGVWGVSWDWLEDSLMKERPMRERGYLLAPLISCAREDKERKKAIRRSNIQKGSKSLGTVICTAYISVSLTWKNPSGELRKRLQ